jgi:hypothetical protein
MKDFAQQIALCQQPGGERLIFWTTSPNLACSIQYSPWKRPPIAMGIAY